jgi:hypothetical protein
VTNGLAILGGYAILGALLLVLALLLLFRSGDDGDRSGD